MIADPSTISGGPESQNANVDATREEVERLRSALYAQSREMAELQRSTPAHVDPDRPDEPAASASNLSGDGTLLNSAQARQLAEDARARERAIRAELLSEQNAMQPEPPVTSNQSTRESRDETPQQWQTHSLVRARGHGEPESRIHDPQATTRPGVVREVESNSAEQKLIVGLNAEMRELRATLSMARTTALGQKREIAGLRDQLVEKIGLLEQMTQNNRISEAANQNEIDGPQWQRRFDESQRESVRLRERLRLNEQETEARDAERILLRSTLNQREDEIATRRTELEELKDRFDVQDRALDNARIQSEQERSRNSESQELLARLRQTLA